MNALGQLQLLVRIQLVLLLAMKKMSASFFYYKARPELQNQYDLNTNMMFRYISGTGAEG